MTQDSSHLRVFSFALRYMGALDTETKGMGRAVPHYRGGQGMCLIHKNKVNSRQELGEQTSVGGRTGHIVFTGFFMGPHSYIIR